MRIRYFIDYQYDNRLQQFLPVGIWIQDMDDLGIDMYYLDETSDEYEEAMWVMNRLVENDLNASPDFLEYHQTRAGYKGMRSRILEEETDLSFDEFILWSLKKLIAGES